MDRTPRITRKKLLESAAVGSGALIAGRYARPTAAGAAAPTLDGKNVIVFLTDQDRATMHYPKYWEKQNLPGITRLKRYGLTFDRAFTNACMCSPARTTWMTGYYPAQHGVKYTLEEDMPADEYPQIEMPLDLPNLGRIASAAGYTPVYKGKWHLNKPAGDEFVPDDVNQYGWTGWNPPDGGANQDISEAGGGVTNHDGRYMNDPDEGVIQYLTSQAAQDQPFFLVVSIVNPHDVLMYPKNYINAGYDDSWLEGDIELPATVSEDLSTKPKAHAQFVKLFGLSGQLRTPAMKRNYLNFYANLQRSSDEYLVQMLDTLEATNLLDSTLIVRTADHGEMGLTHGGMRQKNFNFYEESIRVPLVFSNPQFFPRPCHEKALVSHVDFLPTMASLLKAPDSARADWAGVDYSGMITGDNMKAPQDHIVFTYDDFQAGQKSGPYIPPPNHIVSIREKRWKLAKYFDADGNVPSVYEMYDLLKDPLERKNLAYKDYKRTKAQQAQFKRLKRKLAEAQKSQLAPLP